ncbi:hypothetical protein C8R46DRAFT_1113671 [Mycena filopes]|nr:hypothetical protein C8R46DRAFT_1113671 [Mycena filopes]
MSTLLPPELQREIFGTAVLLNHGDALVKLNLSLVARHVCFWVDHLFYRAVKIPNPRNAAKFLALVKSKPADFFAKTVKVLIVRSTVSDKITAQILDACRGVESLLFWTMYDSFELPLPVGQLPLLRRLSVRFSSIVIAGNDPNPPIWLSSLTHLHLVFNAYIEPSDIPKTLKRLPNLTHVALSSRSSLARHARAVIESCAVLQVLLIMVFDVEDIDDEIYSFDHRIVATTDKIKSMNWTAPYLGLRDPWTSAEDVIAERVAKKEKLERQLSIE